MKNKQTPLTDMTSVCLKMKCQFLVRENNQLKKEINDLSEISSQLVKVLSKVQTLSQESAKNLSDRKSLLEEQLELGGILGDILDTGNSADEWIGRYLLAAKEEAKVILRKALAISEVPSVPAVVVTHALPRKEVTPIELKVNMRPKSESDYQSRLLRVVQTYKSECANLRKLVDEKAISIINKK